RDRPAQGRRSQRPPAPVPAGQHAGHQRRIRRHLGDRRRSGRLALPARTADRAGHVAQRRKRIHVGQRPPDRQPAQPRRRRGAHLALRRHRGQSELAGRRAARRADGRTHRERRTARLDGIRRMTGTPSPGLIARVAALSVVVVFFQIGVVSEVPVFGVNADLTPLLVAFVGLLCGSLVGSVTGFAVGLLVDLALLQTLGLTSLVFTLIGYWAGRLRELRDPQAALTPLLVGAAAAAVALVGYSLMEFLLGVDAPVSLDLLRQIVLGTFVDTIVALPMWAIVRRVLDGALPEDPRRRRRRRAYTTGGLSPLTKA